MASIEPLPPGNEATLLENPPFKSERGRKLYTAFARIVEKKPVPEVDPEDQPTVAYFTRYLQLIAPEWLLSPLQKVCLEDAFCMFADEEIRRALRTVGFWLSCHARPLHEWTAPPAGDAETYFRSLVNHLYCLYPLPEFLEKVWFGEYDDHIVTYIELGKGMPVYGNYGTRNASLTRKMAHWFLTAPDDATVIEAVRWAQIRSVREDKQLYREVVGTWLGTSLASDEFWCEAVVWMARQEIEDYSLIRPALGYIRYLKFGVFYFGEQALGFNAPQADFSFSGRTLASLVQARRRFERSLSIDDQGNMRWDAVPLPDYDWKRRAGPNGQVADYRLTQLIDYGDLVEEGRIQKHCVATYWGSCRSGESSIWSLRKREDDHEKILLTVEVDTESQSIQHAAGSCNRFPQDFEIELLQEWAKATGVEMNEYSIFR